MTQKKVTFGRIFWPAFWAALIVSILGLIIWAIVISSAIGGFGKPTTMEVKGKTVLHITLDDRITERGGTNLDKTSFQIDSKTGLSDLLYGLEEAKNDDRIKGIFLELNGVGAGISSTRELRKAIKDFQKSGKFVVAYNSGEAISLKSYYLASVAKENYGFPSSAFEFLGLGGEMAYFKNTLDNLGVELQMFRGKNNDFKSAIEPFFRTSMSDSARLQSEVLLASLWKDIRQDIANDRKLSIEELNNIAENALVIDVKDAVKHKLIDEAKYRDEVIDILKEKAGVNNDEKLELLSFVKFAKKRFLQDQTLAQVEDPNVAVILAEGGISTSGEGLTSEDICELFKEARENETVKTIVFRVNSPGGSALASDEIWREVELTNKTKKVIVSMGDVAASGGYYVSAPAERIFAEPTTITGSIGVFGMIPYTGKMMEDKLGLTFDRVETNKHAVLTTNRKLTAEETERIQESVDEIYTDFKNVVAKGRNMTTEQVERVARGRVWTGRDALEIGLVDELGGLSDAIEYAAKKAGISDKKVVFYPFVKEDPFSDLLEQFMGENVQMTANSTKIPQIVTENYKKLLEIEKMQGIQMRMPFVLEFK